MTTDSSIMEYGTAKKQTPAQILMGFSKSNTKPSTLSTPLTLPTTPSPSPQQQQQQQQQQQRKQGINLSQLLSGNQSKPKRELIVTLKLPQKKIKCIVTLKSEKLKNLKQSPEQPQRPKINPTQSNHPFFQAVNKRLQMKTDDTNKSINLKAKSTLELPKLYRNHFKVRDIDSIHDIIPYTFNDQLFNHRIIPTLESPSTLDFLLLYTNYKELSTESPSSPVSPEYTVTIDTDPQLHTQIMHDRYSTLIDDFRYAKFFDQSYIDSTSSDNVTQWCDLYHPLNHLESLQSEHIANDVANWVSIAFSKLKRVNRKKRKEKLNASKKQTKDYDSFIVYSDEESESESRDDYNEHVPSLIIEGPIGCGKSSMIHTIVKEELNGFVFEFNSSQLRSRKELEFNLKQIGTTSQVKQNTMVSTKNTDKSVILFDDVDLIDDSGNGDKDFWLGAQDLLTYSYRPVIFITHDLQKVPKNIVEESTVFKFESVPKKTIYPYLDMIALSRKLNLDSKIINKLAKNDVRKSIMELQLLSYHFDTPNMGLVNVTIIEENKPKKKQFANLIVQLEHKLLNMDITYHEEKSNRNNIYHTTSASLRKYDNPPDVLENYELDKSACLEFYSSKYFSNGSRSKICRYVDGEQYNKKHPNNVFNYLTRDKLATDVLPVVHELAKYELARASYNYPRLFDMHPLDAFEGLV